MQNINRMLLLVACATAALLIAIWLATTVSADARGALLLKPRPMTPVQMANFNCGIPPIPPIGCDSDDAVCVCDAEGRCSWQFNC